MPPCRAHGQGKTTSWWCVCQIPQWTTRTPAPLYQCWSVLKQQRTLMNYTNFCRRRKRELLLPFIDSPSLPNIVRVIYCLNVVCTAVWHHTHHTQLTHFYPCPFERSWPACQHTHFVSIGNKSVQILWNPLHKCWLNLMVAFEFKQYIVVSPESKVKWRCRL